MGGKSQSSFVVPVTLYLQMFPNPHSEPVSPPCLSSPSWPQDAQLPGQIHALQPSVLQSCVSLAGEHHTEAMEAVFPDVIQHLGPAPI